MAINLHLPGKPETLKPTITVIGVGGAGGNAVNNMISSNLEGVNFVVANTDAQALENSLTERRIQLGASLTRGLGAGANPEIGRSAAEEALEEIAGYIEGSNMVFITAGMGGGTGTGAAPVVARFAKERGILTVGVITKPFQFEGLHRMRIAEQGVNDLKQYVDTLIVIPNQNLFRIANEKTTFADAFRMADEVLHSGVRGVTDLMIMPGLINLDFADIRTVMSEMGTAMMGTGEGEGAKRALEAAEAAISNPLLDDVSMKGAKGVLINITGSYDMTLFEADEAATRIREEVDPNANIIFGATFNPALEGKMRVSVVATGIDVAIAAEPRPLPQAKAPDLSRFGGKIGFASRPQPVDVAKPAYPQPIRNLEQKPITAPEPVKTAQAPAPQQPHTILEKKAPAPEAKPLALNIDDASSVAFAGKITTAIGSVKYQNEEQMPLSAVAAAPAPKPAAAPAPRPAAPAPATQRTPSFISPQAVHPSQRSFFAMADDVEPIKKPAAAAPVAPRTMERPAPLAQAPREKEAPAAAAPTPAAAGALNFLNRMANVGRAVAAAAPKPVESAPERAVQVVEKPKTEAVTVAVVSPAAKAAADNDYLEIPAFLRRQAN